jgi:UDP-2,3-diacylglucosamine hydrolase
MRAIFLSDAHLRQDTAENYRLLLQFFDGLQKEIRGQADAGGKTSASPVLAGRPIDALYLMGDFFDFWFAKGECYYPGFDRIIRSLQDMKERGVQIHLFEGNHDFFLDDFFADRLGFKVYQNDASIDLDGHRIYVAHGDLVDRSNRGYLLLRKILRSRLVYFLQGILPSRLLWQIALLSSNTSKAMWAQTGKRLTDKMCRFALDTCAEGHDGVILGHSHQPLVWEFSVAGERKVLVTLGDWLSHRSYLDYTDGRFSLKYYENGRGRDKTENLDFSF